MFKDEQAPPETPEQQMLAQVMKELDEIKRYAGGTYGNTDTEIGDIRETLIRIEKKLNETDRQVDKIEQFERSINDIRAAVKRMERKIK